jgi:hypothetical protein
MKDIRSFFTKVTDKRKSDDQQSQYPAKKPVAVKENNIDPNSFFDKKITRTNNNLVKVLKKKVCNFNA